MGLTENSKTLHISYNKHILFIRVKDVTHVETEFNHSKLCNFISLWKMVKNTKKLCRKFFSHKISKNIQKKSGVESFVH